MRVETVKTPDGRFLRAGIWDLPAGQTPRGLCAVLHGFAEFLEKYDEVASELNARGFAVASLDWRGQGASERAAYGNRRGHVGQFDEYDADFIAFLNQIAAPMGVPIVGLAHSMGGHVLLRHLHETQRRVRCGVLIAPMLDIDTGPYSPFLTSLVTFLLNLRRPSTRFVFGAADRDTEDIPFEENRVTSDRARYERTQNLLKAKPFLAINGPTFGWLRAALASMHEMHRRGFAEDIETPLLVFGAGRDKVVRVEAVRAFAKRLPHARYVEIAEAKHEILMETDAIRAQFWKEFDAFIDTELNKAALG